MYYNKKTNIIDSKYTAINLSSNSYISLGTWKTGKSQELWGNLAYEIGLPQATKEDLILLGWDIKEDNFNPSDWY